MSCPKTVSLHPAFLPCTVSRTPHFFCSARSLTGIGARRGGRCSNLICVLPAETASCDLRLFCVIALAFAHQRTFDALFRVCSALAFGSGFEADVLISLSDAKLSGRGFACPMWILSSNDIVISSASAHKPFPAQPPRPFGLSESRDNCSRFRSP